VGDDGLLAPFALPAPPTEPPRLKGPLAPKAPSNPPKAIDWSEVGY
jgi:hypothetical protein